VAELLGLVVSVVLLLIVLLPILTFLRLGRLSRELEELSVRVTQLEQTPAPPASEPAPQPAANADTSAPLAPDAPVAPVAPSRTQEPDLEERIGGRGLLYAGVLVLLFGVSFFLKYAFDNAWINETSRTILGALAGMALIAGGLRVIRGGLDAFGHALVGTGFAILYLVVYAALNFYALIDRGAALVLMSLTTMAAAYIADALRSQPLAFIAVGGGFLTPALIGGAEANQLVLFTYEAVLVIGTLLLSLRHQWLALNVLSYFATLFTVAAWMQLYYTDTEWLRTFLFLTLFCVSFLTILRATRYSGGLMVRAVRGLLFTAPLLYHFAAVIITSAHPPAIHLYLIAFTVAGLWLTVEPYRPVLRLAILLGGLVPLFGDATLPNGSSWFVPNLVTISAVAVLHLMALVDRVIRQEERLHPADLLALHIAGIGVFALLYETLQPYFPGFRGGLAALIAAGTTLLSRWFRPHDEIAAVNAGVLTFTLIAIGIAVQFDGAVAIIGWAAEGAAAVWLGVRANRYSFQLGGVMLWAFAAIRLFESMSTTPAAFTAVFNARTFATLVVVGVGYVSAWKLAATGRSDTTRMRVVLLVAASVLTLGWITAEIRSFWEVRYETPQAYLYEQMLLSLAWGIYGALSIVIGMARRTRTMRYIGIAVIVATSTKVFFYDLWELGGIYRVIGFIGFGVLLVLVSYLYQNRRRPASSEPAPSGPAPTRPEGIVDADRPQL
jgi:uncharacterized membrane protein